MKVFILPDFQKIFAGNITEGKNKNVREVIHFYG